VVATYLRSKGFSDDEIRFSFSYMQAQGQDPSTALFNACVAHEGCGINSEGKFVECEPYSYADQFAANSQDYQEGQEYAAEGIGEVNEAQGDHYDQAKAARTEASRRDYESVERQFSQLDRGDLEDELDLATGNVIELQG